jgi:hypothetical protein
VMILICISKSKRNLSFTLLKTKTFVVCSHATLSLNVSPCYSSTKVERSFAHFILFPQHYQLKPKINILSLNECPYRMTVPFEGPEPACVGRLFYVGVTMFVIGTVATMILNVVHVAKGNIANGGLNNAFIVLIAIGAGLIVIGSCIQPQSMEHEHSQTSIV